VGEDNRLALRVYGTKAGLEWEQEFPEELTVKFPDKAPETQRRGHGYLGKAAKAAARTPPGHPEGYLEAFGNIYRQAFRAIEAEVQGRARPKDLDFPTIDDGVAGMAFIEAAVRSSGLGARWVKLPG
jgi:predicted dehydrogenase